jgi:NAD(P)-dependent dehydrogenase (short-subunit alcohol dehydrogenase family)
VVVTFVEMSLANCLGSRGVAVIQGATGGIGYEFVRGVLKRSPETTVVALARISGRSSQGLDRLRALQNEHRDRLHLTHCDFEDPSTIEQAAEEIKNSHLIPLQKHIGLLINSAGLLHDSQHMPERAIKELDHEWLSKTLQVNSIGPMMLAKSMIPHMLPSQDANTFSVIACLSAKVGSISDNRLGGWYSYRMSKAALNMGIKNMSLELKTRTRGKVMCVALHPGTVKTSLSKPFQKTVAADKLFEPEYSADKLLQVIEKLDTTSSNGLLLSYDGEVIPW